MSERRLSANIRTVGTALGAAGIPFTAGDHDELAAHLDRLFDDPGYWEARRRQGHEQVAATYAYPVVSRRLFTAIRRDTGLL